MLKVDLTQTSESVDWKPFNLYQIFLALTGNILDLITTRVALLHNPYVVEGNTFLGNIPLIDIPITIIGISILQLSKVYCNSKGYKQALQVTNIGSWICTVLPYFAAINNIMLIPS